MVKTSGSLHQTFPQPPTLENEVGGKKRLADYPLLVAAIISMTVVCLASGAWTRAAGNDDPAKNLLTAIRERYQGKVAMFRIDLTNSVASKSFKKKEGEDEVIPDQERIEFWTKDTGKERHLIIIALTPEEKRGTAFRLRRWQEEGDDKVERYMYLPAMDKVTKIKGDSRSRLDPRMGGLLNGTLKGGGADFSAYTVGMEKCRDTICRRIQVKTKEGDQTDLWIKEGATPTIERAVRVSKKGQAQLIMDVEKTGPSGGIVQELSGTLTVPGKVITAFKITETHIFDLEYKGPFSLEDFVSYTREIASASDKLQ